MMAPLRDDLPQLDDPQQVLAAIRQMRMAALYPRREALEEWIVTAKELLERLPPGSMWQLGMGCIDGMIALYNRRFGDDQALQQPPTVPFAER